MRCSCYSRTTARCNSKAVQEATCGQIEDRRARSLACYACSCAAVRHVDDLPACLDAARRNRIALHRARRRLKKDDSDAARCGDWTACTTGARLDEHHPVNEWRV